MTTGCRNLTKVCLAALLAFGLAACGGGSTKKTEAELEMERVAALEMECEAAGGRFESDESCTSAAELVAEAAQMACTDAGGRYEADGSCTSADDVEMERLAGLQEGCEAADGRWNADNSCTTAAELAAEAEQMACTDADGRYESDGSCTSADELAAEQRAEGQMTLITSASEGLKTALMGLDTDDPTPAQLAAVDAAIRLLENALAGGVDLSPNQTADASSQLSAAKTTVTTARATHAAALALATRRTTQMDAITTAQTTLGTALGALMADDADSIATVNNAITTLQGAIDAAADLSEAEKMSAMSDLMDAEVSAATAELDMYTAAAAAGASDEAMLAAYEGQLKAAMRLVAALTANDGSATDIAAANRIIGSATTMAANLRAKIQMAMDAEANEARLASNAVSMKVAEAVNAHTLTGTPMVFEMGSEGHPDFTINRVAGDAEFTLGQTAEKGSKDYRDLSSTAPSAGTGWMGSSYNYSGTSGKRPFTEMASVYTDIEMAGHKAWTQEGLGAEDGLTVNDDTKVVTITSVSATRLTGALLPSAPPEDDDVSTNRKLSENEETRGTLYGVSGTFSCSSDDCTVSRNQAGRLSVDTGALSFTPTGSLTNLMAKYADPDMDYTYFGYWMESTTLRDETKEHEISTFHGGGNSATLTLGEPSNQVVVGTAKYYGAAAGVYVKKDGAGDSLVVTDGTFTADAMLTARFGGSSIAQNDKYEVQGTISDFMDGGTDLGFADLALRGPAPDPSGASFNDAGAIEVGETDGGGTSGNWSGQFYGNVGATTAVTSDDFPSDVSGEFNGHFTNGHVVGAFGAEYDK